MKNIIIEVPKNGASVQFVLRAGASSGQAVIVASDDVEIRLAEPAIAATPQPKTSAPKQNGEAPASASPADDLDTIFKRLTKLKPNKRATAVNSIKAMFQFDTPISDDEANKILEALRRRGNLTIDANDKLLIRSAK